MESCAGSFIRRWGNMRKLPTTRNEKRVIGSMADTTVGADLLGADMVDREVGQLVGAEPTEEDAAAELPMRLPVLRGRVAGEENLMGKIQTQTQARG